MRDGPRFWIGTSGWVYGSWRGSFYPQELPQSRWLEFYAQTFPTVELNNTFYRLPRESTFVGWRQKVPEGFLYAVKASQLITHFKRLRDVQEPLENFLQRARLLEDKLGPILYQLPPSLRRDDDLLEEFMALLPKDLRHCIEFRHQSWLNQEVVALMERYGVGFCVQDYEKLSGPVAASATFAYFRFHGPSGRYAGDYSDEALADWAGKIQGLRGQFREAGSREAGVEEIFCYFNNDIGGYAVKNALTLRGMLERP